MTGEQWHDIIITAIVAAAICFGWWVWNRYE
jgi:hypothetical protein